MGERWDIYSDGWEMGYIQRWVRDGIYTAMGERWDIYSDRWEMGYIQRWVREMGYIQQWERDGIFTAIGERWVIYSGGWEMGYIQWWVRDGIYTAMGERRDIYSDGWEKCKNGRMELSKAMEYGSQKASPDVLKPRNIYIYIYIYIHTHTHTHTHTHIYIYILVYMSIHICCSRDGRCWEDQHSEQSSNIFSFIETGKFDLRNIRLIFVCYPNHMTATSGARLEFRAPFICRSAGFESETGFTVFIACLLVAIKAWSSGWTKGKLCSEPLTASVALGKVGSEGG